MQKRNFDTGKLACQDHLVIPQGQKRKSVTDPMSSDLHLVYSLSHSKSTAQLLITKFEEKYRDSQPAFIEAFQQAYGSASGVVWCVNHIFSYTPHMQVGRHIKRRPIARMWAHTEHSHTSTLHTCIYTNNSGATGKRVLVLPRPTIVSRPTTTSLRR